MNIISPSIEQPAPIVRNFETAMADYHCSMERQVAVAESISHTVWDLLDARCFKPRADAGDIEYLRQEIARLGMRATVLAEALGDHARIALALCDAAPARAGEGA